MKSGKCPKCGSGVEAFINDPVALIATRTVNGRTENIVNLDGSTKTLLLTPFICKKCNFTELYQDSVK